MSRKKILILHNAEGADTPICFGNSTEGQHTVSDIVVVSGSYICMILPFAHSVGSGTEAQCFHVHIHPHATTTRMKAVMADGTLKIDVAAAPEHGKANAALIRFLAKHFNVPRTNVEIVSGQTGRRKVVRVKSE